MDTDKAQSGFAGLEFGNIGAPFHFHPPLGIDDDFQEDMLLQQVIGIFRYPGIPG
jgi:hypothetical protein